jgi:hypothetical protein
MTEIDMIALVPADDTNLRLESIAKDIELLQTTAILRVAERLSEAREIFRYRRDEGGFTGWVESRLNFSERTAYRLLDVHEKFGQESSPIWQTLPRSILYLLAAPSTPEEARDAVIDAAADGERLTNAQVKAIVDTAIAEAREAERPAVEAQLAQLRQDADRREAAVRAEYAGKMFIEPAELEAEVAKAMKPLQRQAEELQGKLNDMKERERKRRTEEAQQAEKKRDPIDNALSLSATAVKRGLIEITEMMTKITPADFVKVSSQSAKATEQTLAQWLSDGPQRARTAISWLAGFLEQFEGRQ